MLSKANFSLQGPYKVQQSDDFQIYLSEIHIEWKIFILKQLASGTRMGKGPVPAMCTVFCEFLDPSTMGDKIAYLPQEIIFFARSTGDVLEVICENIIFQSHEFSS